MQREADLIEEVARVHGLDRLPVTLPARRRAVGRLTPSQRLRRRLEDALRDRGLLEIVAYSFTAPETLDRLGLQGDPTVAVANPLSEGGSTMRPLLLPGLLDAARGNAARGQAAVGLFESAHVYAPRSSPAPAGEGPGEAPAIERHHVAALVTEAVPGSWRSDAPPADYYAVRGILEGLFGGLGADWGVEPETRPFLHPGRSAAIVSAGAPLGWVGEVHPAVAERWDLGRCAAFELDADALLEALPDAPAAYRAIPATPAVLQDIAVVVSEEVSSASVERAVGAGAGELLSSIGVFDVYRGEQVGADRKSLALRLEFRAPDRTLTDDEVAEARTRIEAELAEIGGQLRA